MTKEQSYKSRLKPLKLHPERNHILHFYEEVFWRAYLGRDAFGLFRTLCSLVGGDWYGDDTSGGVYTPSPASGCFSIDLLNSVLGSWDEDLRPLWDKLVSERLVVLWTDRNGRDRLHIECHLPILTPKQVVALPPNLIALHQDLFFSFLRIYRPRPGATITFAPKYNIDDMYEYWTNCTDDTFVPEFDSWESVERGEVREEKEAAAIKAEVKQRKMVRSTLTAVEKQSILERDGRICRYCGGTATAVDHIFPVVQGGDNDPDNLAAACRSCNSKKYGRTPEEAGMILRPIPA